MSFFEAAMLVCFGSAWPFSIYKSYTSRQNAGKSLPFLWIVLAGYAAGVTHKVLHNFDAIIYLYLFNGLMVLVDLLIYYRNAHLTKRSAPQS
jgi:hypothetical protein